MLVLLVWPSVNLCNMSRSGAAHCLPGTMAGWLRKAGLVDVNKEIVPILLGTRADEEWRDVTTRGWTQNAMTVAESLKKLGGTADGMDLDALPQRYKAELETDGGEFRYIFVIGRKPD